MTKERLTNEDELYNKAKMLLDIGELEEALEYSRQLLAQDDENHNYWLLEGRIRLALNEETAAGRAFDRACSIAPGKAEPLKEKAHFLMAQGLFEEVAKFAEEALNYADGDEDRKYIYLLLAEAKLNTLQEELLEEELELLENHFDDVHDHHEHHHDHHAHFSALRSQEELDLTPEQEQAFQEAIELCEKSLAIDSEMSEAWYILAFAHLNLRDYEKTVECLQRAIELNATQLEYWHTLGVTYLFLDETEEAQRAFRRLWELETSPEAEGMEFSREEFQRIAEAALEELEAEFLEDYDVMLPPMSILVEDFPSWELLEEAGGEDVIDPWEFPFSLMFNEDDDREEGPELEITLFQRNIERELLTDESEEAAAFIADMLSELVMEVLFLEEEEEEVFDV